MLSSAVETEASDRASETRRSLPLASDALICEINCDVDAEICARLASDCEVTTDTLAADCEYRESLIDVEILRTADCSLLRLCSDSDKALLWAALEFR